MYRCMARSHTSHEKGWVEAQGWEFIVGGLCYATSFSRGHFGLVEENWGLYIYLIHLLYCVAVYFLYIYFFFHLSPEPIVRMAEKTLKILQQEDASRDIFEPQKPKWGGCF
jgi:hypothetical protein